MTRRDLLAAFGTAAFAESKPRLWRSAPPADCPFGPSAKVGGVAFTGVHSNYGPAAQGQGPAWGDTWYPSWAADGKMYSPYTDGAIRVGRVHLAVHGWRLPSRRWRFRPRAVV